MPLLLPTDYARLSANDISFEEDEPNRFIVFAPHQLPPDLYNVQTCEVLVAIPENYNQAGNDMLWTYPRLVRLDGMAIPNSENERGGDSRTWKGREFCRWSRHWNDGAVAWRPGRDDILTIHRRVQWALAHPDCK